MSFTGFRRVMALAAAGYAGMGLAAPVKAPPPITVLAAIEPGQWELREAGGNAAPHLMCVSNTDMLVQLRHSGAQCARYVIDNQERTATINYDCDGAGNGRTTITMDTPRQIRLQTQGIAQAAPFDMDYSARRLGACPAAH